MKRLFVPLLLIVSGHLSVGQSPYASLQVPKQIQYQGRVSTGTGAVWSGTEGYFAFALVQGATVLWNNWDGTASPSDPGTVSLGAGQVLTQPVSGGVFSLRLGEGSDTNEQIPVTIYFDTTSNSVRTGVKLAVWFSPDGGTFTRLSPDVEFTSVPFAMIAGIAEAVKERAVTAAMLAPNAAVPVGSVMAYSAADPPSGWLRCDGAAVSRDDYSTLYHLLLSSYGNGNGTTTFNLPDYRGRFLRMADYGSGRDEDRASRTAMANGGQAGDNVGSLQGDQVVTHAHPYNDIFYSENAVGIPSGATSAVIPGGKGSEGGYGISKVGWQFSRTSSSTGGSETRPENASVQFIIKY